MGSLERRLERLESRSQEHLDLTKLLERMERPSSHVPCGPLIECIEALPVVQPPEGAD
jgi:hypothetical protein